jgi:hypothetical protein
MKLAVGSDERTQLTSTVIEDLRKRGHTLILFGPISEEENHDADSDWPLTSGIRSRLAGSVNLKNAIHLRRRANRVLA